jgi:hypothetical protein
MAGAFSPATATTPTAPLIVARSDDLLKRAATAFLLVPWTEPCLSGRVETSGS